MKVWLQADYDSRAKQTTPASSAFTRRREVFAGRLAMSGTALISALASLRAPEAVLTSSV